MNDKKEKRIKGFGLGVFQFNLNFEISF